MPVGEKLLRGCGGKSRAACSKRIPRFIITASGMHCLRSNSAIRRNLQPGPLNTYSGVARTQNGRSAKGEKRNHPFACPCAVPNEPRKTDSVPDDATEPQTRYAFRFRAYWLFVLGAGPREKDTYGCANPRLCHRYGAPRTETSRRHAILTR